MNVQPPKTRKELFDRLTALDAVKKKPSQSGQPIAAKDQGAFYTPHASGDAAETTREKR